MNHQEWLDWRNQGIGASYAPIIMGIAPKTWEINTPYKLWNKIVFGKEQKTTFAMQRGKDLEPIAVGEAEKFFGFPLEQQVCIENLDRLWMRATLDACNREKKISIEIKHPNKDDHEIAKSGKVPEHYYAQCQHQIEVFKPEKHFYQSRHSDNSVFVEVKRDDAYIQKLIEKEEVFWQCVLNLEPPQLTELDWISMEGHEHWRDLAMDYKKVTMLLDELEEQKTFLRSQFILFADGQNAMGEGIKLTKYMEKGRVDYEKIPELSSVDLNLYRKNPMEKFKISTI